MQGRFIVNDLFGRNRIDESLVDRGAKDCKFGGESEERRNTREGEETDREGDPL